MAQREVLFRMTVENGHSVFPQYHSEEHLPPLSFRGAHDEESKMPLKRRVRCFEESAMSPGF